MYDNRRATGESGQTSAEYAVMMTVISVGIITALSVMSGAVATLVTSAATALLASPGAGHRVSRAPGPFGVRRPAGPRPRAA